MFDVIFLVVQEERKAMIILVHQFKEIQAELEVRRVSTALPHVVTIKLFLCRRSVRPTRRRGLWPLGLAPCVRLHD